MHTKGTVLAAVLLVMALLVSCAGAPAVTEYPTKSEEEKSVLRQTAIANEAYLKAAVTAQTPVAEMIDVFEEMCREKVEEDSVLFETGTFAFTGEPMFCFMIVRQFPDGEGEYYQIHLELSFTPDEENRTFKDIVWSDQLEGESIFDFIRASAPFAYAATHTVQSINIYWDET